MARKTKSNAVAIIRLRGTVNVHYNVEHTLKLLRLFKPNHVAVYPKSDALLGMLHKVKDHVTYGEVSADMVEHLLKKRGELSGAQVLTDAYIKKNTEYPTIKQFAKAIAKGDVKVKDIPDIQPVFRLNPPRKGFKSLKRSVNQKGDLGYRGEAIDDLLARMA